MTKKYDVNETDDDKDESEKQDASEEQDSKEEQGAKEELTESALKGTHKSDFSLEQEQKAKDEECERTKGNCDDSSK